MICVKLKRLVYFCGRNLYPSADGFYIKHFDLMGVGLHSETHEVFLFNKMDKITTYVKWRKFEEFPNYYISNTGLVQLNKRIIPPRISNNGREYFILSNKEPHKYGRFYTSILVWDVWGDKKRIKHCTEIHHKDKNVFNNHIDNLELLTKQEHKDKHKTKVRKNNENYKQTTTI